MIASVFSKIERLENCCSIIRRSTIVLLFLAFTDFAFAQSCEKNEYDVTKCVKQIAKYDLTQIFMLREVKGKVFEFANNCPENLRIVVLFGLGETERGQFLAKSIDAEKSSSLVCEAGDSCDKIRWVACSLREAKLPGEEKNTDVETPPLKTIKTTKEPNQVQKANPNGFANVDAVTAPPIQNRDNVAIVKMAFQIRENWDIAGQDLRSLGGLSLDECKQACRAESQWVGFTLDRWNRYCFLKGSVEGLRLEPKALSGWREGMKQPPQATSPRVIESYRKRRFSGNVIDSKAIDNVASCQSACSDWEQCLGFSFAINSRQCSRFSQIESYYPDDSVVSGAKRQEPNR